MSQYPIDDIRKDYKALSEMCYLNTGTVGLMSESVLNQHLLRIAEYERYGHVAEQHTRNAYETARQKLGSLINAQPAEIALTRNASDGVNFVLAGLELSQNAVMLTTDQEHPAVLLPMALAARKVNGRIEMLELDSSDDELLTQLRSILEHEQVSIAVLSHVSCESGRRLPIEALCRICHEHGVLTLVDVAQSVGQFSVDVTEIGCDFATGNGHKWLCGPKGTGFLFAKNDRISLLTPAYIGDGSIDPRFDRAKFMKNEIINDWAFRSEAERFEFGTRNWHLYGALTDAIEELERIGWAQLGQHVAGVSGMLKQELAKRPSVTVYTPSSWENSCGIVAFSVEGWNGVTLSESLWQQHGIIQRRVQVPSGVRISCAHYTNTDDIDQFLTALDTLVAQADFQND